MDGFGLDTRGWNLSLGVVAASIVGCGPTIILQGDTEGATGGEPTMTLDDGIEPTGGEIICRADPQCPPGYTCVDGACTLGGTEDSVDYTDYSDYVDYSDYGDLPPPYCSEYGPKGECCDYYECPAACLEPDDCAPEQACLAVFDAAICVDVPELQPCPTEPGVMLIPIDAGLGAIVSLAFVDADGSTSADLVVGYAAGGAAIVREGDPVPQPLPLPGADLVSAVVSGDFTGDLLVDLVVTTDTGNIVLLTGDGAGGFDFAQALQGSGVFTELRALQFDGDGALDVAARGSEPGSVVLRNDGLGLLSTATVLQTTGASFSLAAGEFDGATGGDVVVSGTITDEAFAGAAMVPASLAPTFWGSLGAVQGVRLIDAVDFDGDGIAALVGSTDRSTWTFLESARPQGAASYALPERAVRIGSADLDGDAVPDLVLVGSTLLWAHGVANPNGAEVFDCYGSTLLPFAPTALALGDYDGNGQGDVAVTNGTDVTVMMAF